MNHLDELTINAIADGEATDEHVRECAQCAAAALDVVRLKRAVRALPQFGRPGFSPAARRRAKARPTVWLAAAAVIVLALLLVPYIAARQTAGDLVDLHSTIVASAAPVDVLSTDRHTVKPWFEGKVPFAVDVPELGGTPFHLAGGRVVFLRGSVGLSCFARGPSDQVTVKYRLDGALIYQAYHPIDWPCTWDAWTVKPGQRR